MDTAGEKLCCTPEPGLVAVVSTTVIPQPSPWSSRPQPFWHQGLALPIHLLLCIPPNTALVQWFPNSFLFFFKNCSKNTEHEIYPIHKLNVQYSVQVTIGMMLYRRSSRRIYSSGITGTWCLSNSSFAFPSSFLKGPSIPSLASPLSCAYSLIHASPNSLYFYACLLP